MNCNQFDISIRINKAILKGPGLCSKQAVGILNTFMAVGLPSCYPSFLKRKVMSLYINALHMTGTSAWVMVYPLQLLMQKQELHSVYKGGT